MAQESLAIADKEKEKEEARYRDYRHLGRHWQVILGLLSATLVLSAAMLVFAIGGWRPMDSTYVYLLLGLCLSIVYLTFPALPRLRKDAVPWYDAVLAFAGLGLGLFLSATSFTIIFQGWEFQAPPYGLAAAAALLLLLLEATRRTNGWLIFGICVFFIIAPAFSSRLPGILKGLEFPIQRVITSHVFGAESLIGPLARATGKLIIGYLLFAGVLGATAGGQFFLDLAMCFMARLRGASAKVAVLASGLFGSVSASVVANVMTIGAFTIPAMKRQGYPRHYAGAVEACTSTGDALTPPVMGAGAFVMAELTNTPYAYICLAAALPSVLYYAILLMQADAYAGRVGIRGLREEEIPKFRPTLAKGWPFFLAFAVLVWFIAVVRLEAEAPYWAILALILATVIRRATRLSWRKLLDMLMGGARTMSDLSVVLLTLGVVLGALSLTGVVTTLSYELVDLAGTRTWLLPFFCFIAGFILGTGLPPTPAYVLLAIAIAPAMIRAGFPMVPTHLFCLYMGILSNIIPPVAMACIAAAKLAGEPNLWKLSFTAMRLGIGIFILPFAWVFYPQVLLVVGSGIPLSATLITFFFVMAGLLLMAASFEGYLIRWKLTRLEIPLLAAAGILIAFPQRLTVIVGGCLLAVFAAVLFIRLRTSQRVGQVGLGGNP